MVPVRGLVLLGLLLAAPVAAGSELADASAAAKAAGKHGCFSQASQSLAPIPLVESLPDEPEVEAPAPAPAVVEQVVYVGYPVGGYGYPLYSGNSGAPWPAHRPAASCRAAMQFRGGEAGAQRHLTR